MYDRLIDEYLEDVTRNMGPRQKREVEKELRTHIMDSADALAAERKTVVDDVIISDVIRNMMPASKLAEMYPTPGAYKQMRRLRNVFLVLGGIAAVFLLVAGVLWLAFPYTLDTFPIATTLSIVGVLALAIIVFILFCMAVMFFYEAMFKVPPYEVRSKRRDKSIDHSSSPPAVFIGICITIVLLVLLNLFWSRVPFPASFGTTPHLIPLLSSNFAVFLPWINLLGFLTIAMWLIILVVGKKWFSSLMKAILSAGNVIMNIWMLSMFPFNPELSSGIQSGIKVLLAVVIILTLVGIASDLWKAARLLLSNRATIDQNGGIK
jgi:hypothetical protein